MVTQFTRLASLEAVKDADPVPQRPGVACKPAASLTPALQPAEPKPVPILESQSVDKAAEAQAAAKRACNWAGLVMVPPVGTEGYRTAALAPSAAAKVKVCCAAKIRP